MKVEARRLSDVVGNQLDTDLCIRREDARPFDDVLQLAHVPGPGVLREHVERLRGELEVPLAVLFPVLGEEVT